MYVYVCIRPVESKLRQVTKSGNKQRVCDPGGNSSLVSVGTCRWEFEIGPIHEPTFGGKH